MTTVTQTLHCHIRQPVMLLHQIRSSNSGTPCSSRLHNMSHCQCPSYLAMYVYWLSLLCDIINECHCLMYILSRCWTSEVDHWYVMKCHSQCSPILNSLSCYSIFIPPPPSLLLPSSSRNPLYSIPHHRHSPSAHPISPLFHSHLCQLCRHWLEWYRPEKECVVDSIEPSPSFGRDVVSREIVEEWRIECDCGEYHAEGW